MCVETSPSRHPPHCPTHTHRCGEIVDRRVSTSVATGGPHAACTSPAHIPRIVSHDARTQPHTAPQPHPSRGFARGRWGRSHRSVPASRTDRVRHVTPAPAPSYVMEVVHVAALRGACSAGRVGLWLATALSELVAGGAGQCMGVTRYHTLQTPERVTERCIRWGALAVLLDFHRPVAGGRRAAGQKTRTYKRSVHSR